MREIRSNEVNSALGTAVLLVGGLKAAAEMLNVDEQTLVLWLWEKKAPPREAKILARATRVGYGSMLAGDDLYECNERRIRKYQKQEPRRSGVCVIAADS
jgi:hypothetical protein